MYDVTLTIGTNNYSFQAIEVSVKETDDIIELLFLTEPIDDATKQILTGNMTKDLSFTLFNNTFSGKQESCSFLPGFAGNEYTRIILSKQTTA